MIGTTQKPLEEIIAVLRPYKKNAVIGCNGCAKVCRTGGEEQVAELSEKLRKNGKEIVLEATPDRTCYVDKTQTVLVPNQEKLK